MNQEHKTPKIAKNPPLCSFLDREGFRLCDSLLGTQSRANSIGLSGALQVDHSQPQSRDSFASLGFDGKAIGNRTEAELPSRISGADFSAAALLSLTYGRAET